MCVLLLHQRDKTSYREIAEFLENIVRGLRAMHTGES